MAVLSMSGSSSRTSRETRSGLNRRSPMTAVELGETINFKSCRGNGASHADDCFGDDVARRREVEPRESPPWHTEIWPGGQGNTTVLDKRPRRIVAEM